MGWRAARGNFWKRSLRACTSNNPAASFHAPFVSAPECAGTYGSEFVRRPLNKSAEHCRLLDHYFQIDASSFQAFGERLCLVPSLTCRG